MICGGKAEPERAVEHVSKHTVSIWMDSVSVDVLSENRENNMQDKDRIHSSEHISQHTKHAALCSCQIRLKCQSLTIYCADLACSPRLYERKQGVCGDI